MKDYNDEDNNDVSSINSEREQIDFIIMMVGSIVLTFNAGYVNGCTYQSVRGGGAAGWPVSHVTGTMTKAGLDIDAGNYSDMRISFIIITSFLLGAGISVLEYSILMFIGSFLFLTSGLLLYLFPQSYIGFYSAACACGIQNSITTTYSGSVIRTTHMTGTVTDIGIIFGKLLLKGEASSQEVWKLAILIPLFITFILGGIVSNQVFMLIGDLAICLSSLLFLIIGITYTVLSSLENINLLQQNIYRRIIYGHYIHINDIDHHGSSTTKSPIYDENRADHHGSSSSTNSPLYDENRTDIL